MGKEVFLVPRDMLTRNCLTGIELAVYLSLLDTFNFYDRTVATNDRDILFNLLGVEEPTKAQRKMISLAMSGLMGKGAVVGKQPSQGRYLIQCYESFGIWEGKSKYGYIMVDYGRVRTLIKSCADPREWQKMVVYYYDLMCHANAEGECRYSLEYFAEHTGATTTTLSKYNKRLVELGLIKIIRHEKSTNTYQII